MGIFPLSGGQGETDDTATPTPAITQEADQTPTGNGVNSNLAEVPDVSSDHTFSQAEATKKLEERGFEVEVIKSTSDTVLKGYVISQTPAAGEQVAFGSTVTLLVSEGADSTTVVVPNILGQTKEGAADALAAVGLTLGIFEEGFSDEYPAGQVYYQSYSPGGNVALGTAVDIKISVGAKPRSYSCNTVVEAPTDPLYTGTEATVMLVGSDNNSYYVQNVNQFPVTINVSGIRDVSSGQIMITYTVTVTSTITDENGNQVTGTTQETRSETRNVVFTEEVTP